MPVLQKLAGLAISGRFVPYLDHLPARLRLHGSTKAALPDVTVTLVAFVNGGTPQPTNN